MNSTDYGGGTPVVDVWRRDVGIAIGHLEHAPKLVSLPVTMPDATHATLALKMSTSIESCSPESHSKHFRPLCPCTSATISRALQDYSAVMQKRGCQIQSGAGQRFRSHLVRLGLWQDVYSVAGGTCVAGRQEAGLCVGGRG